LNIISKEHYQNFLKSISFEYFITVEPNPRYRMAEGDVISRVRKIEFYLNKKYLRSTFSKWKPEDRLWFIIFREGSKRNGTEHFHIMLHVPKKFYRKSREFFDSTFLVDFHFVWWSCCNAVDQRGSLNFISTNKPIHILRIEDSVAVSTYCSKYIDVRSEELNFWFAR